MFLKTLLKQNTKLIDAAISYWQQGEIYPDSYVIDVEQTEANARLLVATANRYQIKLYLMSKQFGRNPELCRRLLACGFQGMVAVDFKEARQLYRNGSVDSAPAARSDYRFLIGEGTGDLPSRPPPTSYPTADAESVSTR